MKYLNEKCGTKRAVGGGLNEEVNNPPFLETATKLTVIPYEIGWPYS